MSQRPIPGQEEPRGKRSAPREGGGAGATTKGSWAPGSRIAVKTTPSLSGRPGMRDHHESMTDGLRAELDQLPGWTWH
ncbi:hypothetical protein An07g01490 [Aspergillus niger]|uniref:Uncharacterized protein n=2 Tax=Aspergillus niger TaxID=5061 RepID=A2QMB3_ASPNC|nr:hypothetical protein An07g01490 [Aspergillus niger]CAK96594.1 hypothetical protein An07g01490 [Aspergillus niger]